LFFVGGEGRERGAEGGRRSKIFLFAPVLTVGDANTSNLTSTDVVGGDDAEEQGTTEPNA
jgi:hypothetical protein